MKKQKKAQVLGNLQAVIIPVIAVALVLVIGFVIMAEMKDQVIDTQSGSLCPTGYSINSSDSGLLCCNSTGGQTCGAGNTTDASMTFAWNGTSKTQEAMSTIPTWLPIIIITIIGSLLLGLVAFFRARR